MLAVQPWPPTAGPAPLPGPHRPIQAYVDGLYGDRRGPCLTVNVDGALMLDWPTEAIVLRIVQEAVSNVWRHASASQLIVTIRSVGGVVEVKVADDGSGFDPGGTLFESGIEVMRSCTALGAGTLRIDSAPGQGTRVVAAPVATGRGRRRTAGPGRPAAPRRRRGPRRLRRLSRGSVRSRTRR